MDNPYSEEKFHNQDSSKISWKADDFYYHSKSFGWYAAAIFSSFSIAIIPWLIGGRSDYIAPGVTLLALLGLTIYAGRRPEKKSFELSNSSIKINSQSFNLSSFSRYWVETYDTHTQITFVGVKRIAMPVSLCLEDKAITDKVLAILRNNLPETIPSNNIVDWLMRKIKF